MQLRKVLKIYREPQCLSRGGDHQGSLLVENLTSRKMWHEIHSLYRRLISTCIHEVDLILLSRSLLYKLCSPGLRRPLPDQPSPGAASFEGPPEVHGSQPSLLVSGLFSPSGPPPIPFWAPGPPHLCILLSIKLCALSRANTGVWMTPKISVLDLASRPTGFVPYTLLWLPSFLPQDPQSSPTDLLPIPQDLGTPGSSAQGFSMCHLWSWQVPFRLIYMAPWAPRGFCSHVALLDRLSLTTLCISYLPALLRFT